MNWATPIQKLRDNLPILKKILYLLMAAAIVFDIFNRPHEVHFFGDRIPAFWSAFGLICCILMIRIMKGIAHTWLMKKEDYYG